MVLPRGLVIFWAITLGLCVGSFLNVVIWRVPRGESVRRPPSHCPACGAGLRWWQNIPLVGWLLLRGRCGRCASPISIRYPTVEAGCAALFGAITASRPGMDAIGYCFAAAGMLALSYIDIDHRRLPDAVLAPTLLLTLFSFGVVAVFGTVGMGALGRAAAGALIGFAALGLIHVIQPAGMGFGDVKLALLCGLLLGWRGLGFVPIGLFAAFVLGAGYGVALLATGRVGRRATVPFGPFLCVGALGTAVWGGPLVTAVGRVLWP